MWLFSSYLYRIDWRIHFKKGISTFTHKKTHLHFIECSAPVVLDRWSFWVALACTGDMDCLDVCIGLGEEWLTLEDQPLVKAVWGTGVLTWLWTLWIEGTLCGIKRSIWERLYKTLLSVRAVLNILKLWHLDIQIIINIPVLCSFCFSILQVYLFCFDLIFQHSCSQWLGYTSIIRIGLYSVCKIDGKQWLWCKVLLEACDPNITKTRECWKLQVEKYLTKSCFNSLCWHLAFQKQVHLFIMPRLMRNID